MDTWWNDWRDTLMRWAISLDGALGKAEDSLSHWWSNRLAEWPNPDQVPTGQPMAERAIDPAELERVDRAHRFAATMTRGRWR